MKFFKLLVLGFILAFTISCDNEEAEPDVTLNDFVGSWEASSSLLTNNSNSGEQIELISNGGTINFTVLEGGGVRTWITFGTFSDEWDSQLTLTGNNTLLSTPVEETRDSQTFTFELEEHILTLTNSNDSFDFTLSGANEVAATSVAVFVRQ